jgi:hypothetical protein
MSLLQIEPTGQYKKNLVLYEWLLQTELPIADLAIKNYVPLLERESAICYRHKIIPS